MAITTAITPAKKTIKFAESADFTVAVTGAPVDSTTTVVWKADGTVVQSADPDGLTVTIHGNKIGKIALTADVTVTPQTGSPETSQATAELTIQKLDITGVGASVTATPATGKVGEEVSAEMKLTGVPADATVVYKWSTGETTAKVKVTPADTTDIVFQCEATVSKDNYNDFKISKSKTVKVDAKQPDLTGDYHIWPLPDIDAAFMYGSWWALDEIQAVTKAGNDWQTETTFVYQDEVDGFKKILQDYNLVMIQESRNGRIIDRETLESGLIY